MRRGVSLCGDAHKNKVGLCSLIHSRDTEVCRKKEFIRCLPSGLGPAFLTRMLGWHDRWRGCRHAEVYSRLEPSNCMTEGEY